MSTITTIEAKENIDRVVRTAAYCRVSSDSTDQLHSFASQVQYYTKAIADNPAMELVDIYADEGLTGTKTDKREDFNRLVADCQKHKIDRVLTKSVSRFARNTVDSLMYARMLKEYGVSILFEKENIDTAYMSSELLLALSGAQAQEESISISKNMRWSCERRMKNGTYIASSAPYGYELKNGELHIVEHEAEIVRKIFDCYLSGMGKKAIADMLNKSNDTNTRVWRTNTIDYILSNERYVGDSLFQKYYTTDSLPFKRKINRGERQKYYVENTNISIIPREIYEATQKLLCDASTGKRTAVSQRPLLGKIICRCGYRYTHIVGNQKHYWGCKAHDYDSLLCNSKRILEADIYDAFIILVNKLRNCYTDILPIAISQTERLQMKADGLESKIKQIDKEIADLNNKHLVLTRLNSKGILRAAEYTEQSNDIRGKVNILRTERRKLLHEQDDNSILCGLKKLNDIISNIEYPLTEFDETIFESIVQEITIPTDTSISFKLLGNLILTENIPDRRRCKRK